METSLNYLPAPWQALGLPDPEQISFSSKELTDLYQKFCQSLRYGETPDGIVADPDLLDLRDLYRTSDWKEAGLARTQLLTAILRPDAKYLERWRKGAAPDGVLEELNKDKEKAEREWFKEFYEFFQQQLSEIPEEDRITFEPKDRQQNSRKNEAPEPEEEEDPDAEQFLEVVDEMERFQHSPDYQLLTRGTVPFRLLQCSSGCVAGGMIAWPSELHVYSYNLEWRLVASTGDQDCPFYDWVPNLLGFARCATYPDSLGAVFACVNPVYISSEPEWVVGAEELSRYWRSPR